MSQTPILANTVRLSRHLCRVVAVGASLVKGGHAIMGAQAVRTNNVATAAPLASPRRNFKPIIGTLRIATASLKCPGSGDKCATIA